MYVHHLGLYCILFRRFLISKIDVALQLTKFSLKKVTITTIPLSERSSCICLEPTGVFTAVIASPCAIV